MPPRETLRWSHFHHAADIGVRGCGPTLEAAFEQTALAMTAVTTDPATVRDTTRVTIHCAEADIELLLVDWLNALVFESATRNMLFSRFEVSLRDSCLDASAWGEAVDRERHQPAAEVKGATYTALKVEQDDSGRWCAQCVVDV
jgi:tRNA nucleotidyltransferase (CCA-adding enzyme)